MGDYVEDFQRKLEEFDSLIRFAAKRYRIQGVLEPDDLYQEGLCILNDMFLKYDFDPDSSDFRKMFKTELWHGLAKVLHLYKTRKRDWKQVVPKDYSQLERTAARSARYGVPLDGRTRGEFNLSEGAYSGGLSNRSLASKLGDTSSFSSGADPEQIVEYRESIEEVDKFIELLTSKLDDEARVVLFELLYPPSWEDIPEEFKVNGTDDEYWRKPRKIPQHVMADMLGWPLIRVRRAISRIRKNAVALGGECGLELISEASATKRKRRRKIKDVYAS